MKYLRNIIKNDFLQNQRYRNLAQPACFSDVKKRQGHFVTSNSLNFVGILWNYWYLLIQFNSYWTLWLSDLNVIWLQERVYFLTLQFSEFRVHAWSVAKLKNKCRDAFTLWRHFHTERLWTISKFRTNWKISVKSSICLKILSNSTGMKNISVILLVLILC